MTRFGALFAPWVLSLNGITYDTRHDRLFPESSGQLYSS